MFFNHLVCPVVLAHVYRCIRRRGVRSPWNLAVPRRRLATLLAVNGRQNAFSRLLHTHIDSGGQSVTRTCLLLSIGQNSLHVTMRRSIIDDGCIV